MEGQIDLKVDLVSLLLINSSILFSYIVKVAPARNVPNICYIYVHIFIHICIHIYFYCSCKLTFISVGNKIHPFSRERNGMLLCNSTLNSSPKKNIKGKLGIIDTSLI